MSEDLKGTNWVANELGLTVNGLRYKYGTAGIIPTLIKRKLYFTTEQFEELKNYKGSRSVPKKHEKYEAIISYWRTNENNSSPQISRIFGVKESHINSILNNYLKGLKIKT
jgi:hypothetical protein